MSPIRVSLLTGVLLCPALHASIVVVSAVPDPLRPLTPLTDHRQQILTGGNPVKVGAFPGLSGDDLLNLAKTGGYDAVLLAFVPFGQTTFLGDGVGGAPGQFEIAVREESLASNSPLASQPIHLLVSTNNGSEFLIARFPDHQFIADTETGVEPLVSLHLSSATLIVGTRFAESGFAISPSPVTGSYINWIQDYPALATPEQQDPANDPDADGKPNFLEYALGTNPASGSHNDGPRIYRDMSGAFWLNFNRRQGIGHLRYAIETTSNPAQLWQTVDQPVTIDDSLSIEPGMLPMKLPLPSPTGSSQFYRLRVWTDQPGPEPD